MSEGLGSCDDGVADRVVLIIDVAFLALMSFWELMSISVNIVFALWLVDSGLGL